MEVKHRREIQSATELEVTTCDFQNLISKLGGDTSQEIKVFETGSGGRGREPGLGRGSWRS